MDSTSTKPKTKKQEMDEQKALAKARLLKLCPIGATVSTGLKHVSRSGMFRRIRLYVAAGSEIIDISWEAAKVMDYKLNDQGLAVSGCGMDMGFHLVHSLGYALYGDLADRTDAKAVKLRRKLLDKERFYFTQGNTPAPDPAKPGREWFGGAGYALTHRWI